MIVASMFFASAAAAEPAFMPVFIQDTQEIQCSNEDITKGLLIGGGIGLVVGVTGGISAVAGMTVIGTGSTVGWAGALSSPILTGSTVPVAVGTSILPTGLGAYTGFVVSCAGEEIASGAVIAYDTTTSAISYAATSVVDATYYWGSEAINWVTE